MREPLSVLAAALTVDGNGPYLIAAILTFAGVVVTAAASVTTVVISNRRAATKGERVVEAVSGWEVSWEERGKLLEGYRADLAAATETGNETRRREEECRRRLAAVERRLARLERR